MNPNDVLSEVLEKHGISVETERDWLIARAGNHPPISARRFDRQLDSGHISTQLDIRVALPGERVLVESFAGWGDTSEEAIGRAFYNFSMNSLHVLLGAFYGRRDDQITVEEWSVGGAPWTVYVGGFGTQSSFGQPPIPDGLFATIEQAIVGACLATEDHWVRVFYCNVSAGEKVSEALFDNQTWSLLQQNVAALPWESPDAYFSVRNFLVLRPFSVR